MKSNMTCHVLLFVLCLRNISLNVGKTDVFPAGVQNRILLVYQCTSLPEYEVCGEPGVPPGGDDVERPPAPQVTALQVRAVLQELKSEDSVVGLGRFLLKGKGPY